MKKIHAILAVFALSSGCMLHPDIMVPSPLTGHKLDRSESEIEKTNGFQEQHNGLPAGSLSQTASISALDDSQACFAVKMHGLNAQDVEPRQFKTVLKAQPSGKKMDIAKVISNGATSKTYNGLVAHNIPSGTETYCANRNSDGVCTSWRTRDLYTTVMEPGPVTVYEGNAKICFAHEGLLTAQTQQVVLDVFKITMAGFMPVRTGTAFRWGFSDFKAEEKKN
jgi:hypothetical protein